MVRVPRPGPNWRGRIWRQHLSVLVPILGIYCLLAFYHIDSQSLWTDEVLSIKAVRSDKNILARELCFNRRRPVYFRLLQLSARWGTSEFALRAFSALLGGVTVGLAYLMGLRLGGRRPRPAPAGILAEGVGARPAVKLPTIAGSREYTTMEPPYTFFAFSSGFSLGPSVRELHISRALAALRPHALTLAISGLLFGSLFNRHYVWYRRPFLE